MKILLSTSLHYKARKQFEILGDATWVDGWGVPEIDLVSL